jgi:predicted transcriptional regulator
MPDNPRSTISDAEAHVMDVLWRAPTPLGAEQIVDALSGTRQWQAATVKTLLNRLLNKGAIAAHKDGRRFLYHAVLTRDDWLAAESGGLLDRLFGGRVAPLVAYFGSQRKLSRADIEELRKLIDEFDDGE